MEIHSADSKMFTTTEVARLLHVHDNTVRRLANEGFLQVYRLGPRGDRRFTRGAIERFLEMSSQGMIRPYTQEEPELAEVT